jgi:hypothetical protein
MKQFTGFALRLLPVLLFALACLAAGPARAGTCSNPTGNEGTMTYNKDYHAMQFCDGTTWDSMKGGGGDGLTLISTKTASASASLQFTSLPTTYNTLFLNCAGLMLSTTTSVYYRVGEGAGPTWQSGAHYTSSYSYVGAGGNGSPAVTNATDIIGGGTYTESNTFPSSMKLYIDNVASSTVYKNIVWQYAQMVSAGAQYTDDGASYWNNDTNPITGLEIVPGAGNIASGTCSLYGMN